MSSYTDVKNLIISNIKANGQREITGPILQDVLLNMLENSSEADVANKEYVDNKIADIPVEKGTGYNSLIPSNDDTNNAYGKSSTIFGHGNTVGNIDKIITDPDDPQRGDDDAGYGALATGLSSVAKGRASHSEGEGCLAEGAQSHAEGNHTTASGKVSHAEGSYTTASGEHSHAEGQFTKASNNDSHAEGCLTHASGECSHAEGYLTGASKYAAHSEGQYTSASGEYSHAEGYHTEASKYASHSEGDYTTASGQGAHSEGARTTATGAGSHVEGIDSKALGRASHAEGLFTIANNEAEHAEGKYNISIPNKTIHTIGGGTSNTNRKNAHEIHFDGKHYIYGIGGYDGTNSQTEGIKTVQEVIAESANVVQIKYTYLKSLRDAGKLVPGTQYRITDYTCTTTQANTKSAGHVFDIIVTADDENTLNEEARAALHTGDEYFSGCNLNVWKIWYCLDNDTTRFAWADATNGKGVIYRMIDEFNNDVPYDFKNIQFKHPNDTTTYPYYYYTFASGNIEANTDYSLSIANNCYSNNIGEYIYNNEIRLNCIIFMGLDCYGNSFENGCNNISFGNSCKNNIFGNGCWSISFGNSCYGNSFGNSCRNNSFGNNCYDNSFGNGCIGNTIGSDNSFNSFGNGCCSNSLGNNCIYNSFENFCYSNSFGNRCGSNSFGSYSSFNSLGYDCYGNSFGNHCQEIKFASNSNSASSTYKFYQNNHFGDGCQFILFTGAETTSKAQQVQNYNFAQGLRGTSSAYLTIDGKRNLSYETYVSKDTDGTIKESVIAEFENKLGNCVDLTTEQTINATKTFSAGIDLNGTRISKVGSPVNTDDAANKEYVDALASTKQDVLTAGKGIVIDDNNTISINFDTDIFKVVPALPEAPASGDENKIHLVLSSSSEEGNTYDEYIWVNNYWERIGSFRPSVDLSGYAEKSYVDSQIEGEAVARTEADTELQTQINGKQEALTLTVKDNGNIVLANIQGQSKEFMPATPSGDPMHYAYVAAGAEYNNTGADIVRTTPWADMLDDDYTGDYGKTVIHRAGYWYLNGLGDITNEEIRKIYQATSNFPTSNYLNAYFSWVDFRTNFKGVRPLSGWAILNCVGIADGSNNFIILDLSNLRDVFVSSMTKINKIKHILGNKFLFNTPQNFETDSDLITVRFNKLSKNIYIGKSSVLSVKSVLYMIQNEAATSPITITLHADVYNRCMANADILTALEVHTNISLASA